MLYSSKAAGLYPSQGLRHYSCANLGVEPARASRTGQNVDRPMEKPLNKHYISPQQLLQDSYQLGWQVYASGYRPDFIIGVWRGGTPVAIAVHELLHILGVHSDHTAIRTSSYSGMQRSEQEVVVDGLEYLDGKLSPEHQLLLVDDVHDTGLSLQQVVHDLGEAHGELCPEIRLATPYYKPGKRRSAVKLIRP